MGGVMSMNEKVQKWFEGLPEGKRAAFLAHLDKVQELLHRLAVADGSSFRMSLDYTGPSLIDRLVDKGGPWGKRNPNINDANFPVTGSGVVAVRFRIIPGVELKSADGLVWRNVVETKFREMGMRFPNAAEALLFPAEDQQIGRGDHPLVAFVQGSQNAFFVGGDDQTRNLELDVNDLWFSLYDFLGVCE